MPGGGDKERGGEMMRARSGVALCVLLLRFARVDFSTSHDIKLSVSSVAMSVGMWLPGGRKVWRFWEAKGF
jgi:hypothetical protein